MEIKRDILWRIYLVYFLICLFAVSVLVKVFVIRFYEGDVLKQKALHLNTKYFNIDAVRGNIFASDGSLLATSVPYYDIGMDVNTDYLTDKIFYSGVGALSDSLANLFKEQTSAEYKQLLVKARKSGKRFVQIKRRASYKELQALKRFPLFNKGRNKGGFVYMQTNIRTRPFRTLAARTIGYSREGIAPVGLEGAYDNYLRGVSGQRLMQKIAGGVWMPLNDENEVEPQDGCDLVSTIDINIQDVAEYALLKQLQQHNAEYGTVILMEVKTGEIKAIANLSRNDTNQQFYERYNYAIGATTEPGSTFKLASLIVGMEDGFFDLNDTINIENGVKYYYGVPVKDSHAPKKNKVSVQEVFEESSNVGVAKLITDNYAKNPQKFVDGLVKLGISTPLKLSIPGEGVPKIRDTKDKEWSGVSLPFMSIGYESTIAPIHTLTLYNAVANNGKMVKPLFVREITKRGKTVKKFNTEVINEKICSKKTIDKAKKMLEGVVLNGTAQSLASANYSIAGKTGTAQIARGGAGYKDGLKVSYRASFVGYFPADNPKYSCIVMVSAPSNDVYYGALVAGPVFKEIADKVYSTSLEIHSAVNRQGLAESKKMPETHKGDAHDSKAALKQLNIPFVCRDNDADWVVMRPNENKKIQVESSSPDEILKKGLMPDLKGMLAKDAVYLLENNGVKVTLSGRGVIKNQSIEPGKPFVKGINIQLELS